MSPLMSVSYELASRPIIDARFLVAKETSIKVFTSLRLILARGIMRI